MNDSPNFPGDGVRTDASPDRNPRGWLRHSGHLIVGLVFVVLGMLFLLEELSPFQAGIYVLRFWPALLVVYGLGRIAGGCCLNDRLWGGFWTFVGTWMLLEHLDIVQNSIWDFWPVIFIVIGLSIVLRSMNRPPAGVTGTTDTDRLNAFALWSSVERRYTSRVFQGGEATAIMGGVEIDLRQASVPEGQPVAVDLFAMWGGIDLRIPGDWSVRNEAMAILGAVEDTRKEVSQNPTRQIVIRGTAIMGGIEIKN